mgnify:CR=1 FL=1
MSDTRLSEFIALSDAKAGEALGWPVDSRKAVRRGLEAKRIAIGLSSLDQGQLLPLHDIKSAPVIESLDALFQRYPDLLSRTEGYLPKAEAMMAIVSHRMKASITSENLSLANEVCSAVVSEVLIPRLRKFIKETLNPDGPFIPIGEDDLIAFLTGPYSQYAKAEANGLISRAGSLNEALVREAIKASGLDDAIQTGTEGNADIQVVAKRLNPPQTLSVEVKSYGARERLVRGLHDCNAPKVGVGFFNRSSEFNSDRTSQLLATNASAIYLPEQTLSGLDSVTRARQNSHGGQFYRSLARFGVDMKRFSEVGAKAFLPD